MSYFNNNIMSIDKFNAADAKATAYASNPNSGMNNLDIYIPRIDGRYTEENIMFTFRTMGVGLVAYADFVATKDPETKEVKFYSAFVKLLEWNTEGTSGWYNQFRREKQTRIQITRSEFWVLLPAKTPLSRAKVNTHQLAAYTDELFVKLGEVEKTVTENITVSSTHFQNLLAKSEEQAAQIDQLLKIVAAQANQIENINNYLMVRPPSQEFKRARALTIEDLTPAQTELKDSPKTEQKTPVYCDDECFFFKPLAKSPAISPTNQKADIFSGTFSCDLDDLLYPAAKSCGISKEEARKTFEEEWANSQRVKGSINYCGNE
jgi:hypothetical protein